MPLLRTFCTLVVFLSCSNETTTTISSENLPDVLKKFSSNVMISEDGNHYIFVTNDIPNHNSPYFTDHRYEAYNGSNTNFHSNPNRITEQNITLKIPKNPQKASTNRSTELGPIGISVNGVVLYNQFAGPNQPLTNEIDSFDQYNGHPQQQGQYHYHVEPTYLTSQNGRDAFIGLLLDGFPVYGPVENGTLVDGNTLDDYHGHSHATSDFPEGIYHYHITGNDPYINGGTYYGTPGTVTQ
jgi:hypothetical protein